MRGRAMTTKILAVVVFIAGALGGSLAYAQGFNPFTGSGRFIVDSELILRGDACWVRDTMSDGTTRDIPCDELDYEDLEDYSEFEWDDFCARFGRYLSPDQYREYCGGIEDGFAIRLSDNLIFSRVRMQFDANYIATAPFTRGFLATEPTPGTLLNPAYDLSYKMTGYKAKLGLDGSLSIDRFGPLKISAGLEFGSLSGTGSASGINLDNFGVTSVGEIPGVFVNYPTDVLSTDFSVDRSFGALSTRISFPLFRGEYDFAGTGLGNTVSGLDYDVYAIAGKRLGWLSQTEQTLIETSTPAYSINGLSQIRYDTQFDGGFMGLQAGLGMDKRMPLLGRDNLAIEESFAFLVGYDHYQFHVTDSVDANILNGTATHVSSNEFDVSAGLATFEAKGSIGLGNGKWYAGLRAGVSAGLYPEFDYNRPDSEAPSTPLQPTLELKSSWAYELGADFKMRF